MAEYDDREHYIPLRKADLVELLCSDPNLPFQEREPLRRFCLLISSIYHFEYLERLEKMKDAFAPFDPDAETITLKAVADAGKRQRMMGEVFDEFIKLMERANFENVGRAAIEEAVAGGATDWGVNMDVDFDIFDRLEVFVRGEGVGKRTRRRATKLWKAETVEVDIYKRLVLMLKLKPHRRLPKTVDTDAIYLKLFKDIPKLDMEMLLPGARVQMPGLKRLTMGGSLLGGLGALIYKVGETIVTSVEHLVSGAIEWTFVGPVGALLGFGYKQYSGYQKVKTQYSLLLSESLYYQNLDNNAGVLTRLLDEAEEQECREAILAWYCLWRYAPPQGWTAEQLDDYVEMYLESRANLLVDFEIGDAMDKVLKLRIVQQIGDHYKACPLPKALELLDYRWDNYFQYNVGGE
jgi:hypothetical protein